jgi:hypothetical protein
VTLEEILEALQTIEDVSVEWGREIERGAAVAAAREAAAPEAAAKEAAAGTALQPA